MKRFFLPIGDQRGVTLIEMLAVLVIMGLAFGAILSFLDFNYSAYSTTTERSDNQRTAATIIEKLTQDVRRSVADVEAGVQAVTVAPGLITITKQLDPLQTATYELNGQTLTYTTDQNVRLELTDRAQTVTVTQDPANPRAYAIRVIVGDIRPEASVTLETTVTRYDWGR